MSQENIIEPEVAEEEEMDFGETVAHLINHGLSDSEIFEALVDRYGHHAPEFCVARIRVMMETWVKDPFPQGDLTAYLEIARLALEANEFGQGILGDLDFSVGEENRLKKQLEEHLDGN